MSGQLLTTQSTLMCPHGGTVSIVSSNTRVNADNAPLALSTDTFTVSGCPFQIPVGTGTVPHPCVTVQWVMPNLNSSVNGARTLSMGSAGICLAADQVPQGKVVISMTQAKASGK